MVIETLNGSLGGGYGGSTTTFVTIRSGSPIAFATASTAPAALTIPLPQVDVEQVLPPGNGVAVLCKKLKTSSGVRVGSIENISETTPATCGVAMLVPLKYAYPSEVGTVVPLSMVEYTELPGALISIVEP